MVGNDDSDDDAFSCPIDLAFAKVNLQRKAQQSPFVNSFYMLISYFAVWSGSVLLPLYCNGCCSRSIGLAPT
jgi:hypothetical protein